MKFYHCFEIREQGFPPELYNAICSMKPESRGKEDFILESKPGDEINAALIKRLVDFCEQHSVRRAVVAREFNAYGYTVVRHYEADDLEAAPLLMLETQNKMFRGRLSRDESGRLMLPAKEAGTSFKFASGMFNHFYIVADPVRKLLETSQLAGFFFRETTLKGTSIRATTEALWEIDSDIKLPKMTNSAVNPHSRGPSYMIIEGHYRDAEPHYQQSDLQSLGNFDMARTYEQLGSEPGMIVSQRFYQTCLRHKIQLRCRPVRVDP